MKLHIVSPTGSQNYTVNWIELNTDQGNFIVQNGHVPMIVWLKQNSHAVFSNLDGTTTNLPIKSGFAEINRTHTMILITHE